ncbi:MAG: macro domain-containing protein [Candidatus Omnitrophota bacterium]|nr:macro domain-containing protein [Candidatus Omnitrophota bacterium]
MGNITIKKSDITKENVDVIVNAANTGLNGGGGVDGAIHSSGGSSILKECRAIGGCKTGFAVMTNAGKLLAKKIIHTPGPVWRGGTHGEAELLRNCYMNSFYLAKKNNLKTIAFPAISAGIYAYPISQAAAIALEAGFKNIKDFDEIRYICFSERDYQVYLGIYKKMTKE